MDSIHWVLRQPQRKLHPPPFRFDLSDEATAHNFDILKKHNFSIEKVLANSGFSPSHFGSEFKETQTLEKLFGHHPYWERMKKILDNGTTYEYHKALPENTRKGDFDAALARGNHKSALKKKKVLEKALIKETQLGYQLPLRLDHLRNIPEIRISPMGVADQLSINELGEIIEKDRVTHDLSFPGEISGESVNSLIDEDSLFQLIYGHMHSRCIHHIVATRRRFPNTRILGNKADFKSAYRRQHLAGKAALHSTTQAELNGSIFGLIALRLTFGGRVCPFDWCSISEPIVDLANALLSCKKWNPLDLHSPAQEMVPQPKYLPENIPLAQARSLLVNVPSSEHGRVDGYIDDLPTFGPDLSPNHRRRLAAATFLAIHITSREVSENEPIPRESVLALNKLAAEGGLAEVLVVLGWQYDTRRLLVSLPFHKYTAWKETITTAINSKSILPADLDKLINRLNHLGAIMKMGRHFLSRLRHRFDKSQRSNNKHARLSLNPTILKDLKLWLQFLDKAHLGINMNLLVFREPNIVYRTDACEYGLGGSFPDGSLWRWEIPTHLLHRAHITLLEFLAMLVPVWMDILARRLTPLDCFLSLGDNANAVAWVFKSNFKLAEEGILEQRAKLEVSRKFADLILSNDLVAWSQWLCGEDNIIPDICSRDWHLLDHELINNLTLLFSNSNFKNIPHFKMRPVPKEIDSFLCSVLQNLPKNPQRFKTQKTSGFEPGVDGKNTFSQSACKAMFSWKHLLCHKGMRSASASAKPSDKETSADNPKETSQEPFGIPLDMYRRPLSLV